MRKPKSETIEQPTDQPMTQSTDQEAPPPLNRTPGPIVPRNVKHTFTDKENLELAHKLANVLDQGTNIKNEFEAIKASYKAKITEAESIVGNLSASIRAGFEMRVKDCQVMYRTADKAKDFLVVETGEHVGTEPMTDDDLQQDLIRAEKDFECREEIVLFDAGGDKGILAVGRMKDKWYSALRLKIKQHALNERLDSEQKNYLKRWDAILTAADRALEWIKTNLGKDVEKGFEEPFDKALEPHKERVE